MVGCIVSSVRRECGSRAGRHDQLLHQLRGPARVSNECT
ncbi:hypothetical protein SAMCFNEI73_Ch3127 [Sinorhizobium americanum]|uniref:Uncharacterized protein n=1 Tax=Sinorhizobium americanum TaxID=194963 RepID=A0A1L3LQN0_9HYPH|nr:hypothetical protein SAMCCGM7_Ch3003 [Sinorhizobium americanum CCGM7]APG92391.1 hypothetical protein SAMCFNEI73_Ch3127 [Sinorhizobium americanum]